MARLLVRADSDKLAQASAVVSSTPLTMACWFRILGTDTNAQALMALGNAADNDPFYVLRMRGDIASDPVQASQRNSAGTVIGSADSTSGMSLNTWHHAAGVFSASNSRTVYLDGGNNATNTTNVTGATTVDRTGVGVIECLTPTQFLDGDIAEAAIWNVALTAAEVASLARGFQPWRVRPASLVSYWPLIGHTSPEIDIVGKLELTVTGTARAAHPRVMLPRPRGNAWFLAVAAFQAAWARGSNAVIGAGRAA